jgi:hypothetical protein
MNSAVYRKARFFSEIYFIALISLYFVNLNTIFNQKFDNFAAPKENIGIDNELKTR